MTTKKIQVAVSDVIPCFYLLEISLFMIFKTQAHKCSCHIIFVVMLSRSVSLVGGVIFVLNFLRF